MLFGIINHFFFKNHELTDQQLYEWKQWQCMVRYGSRLIPWRTEADVKMINTCESWWRVNLKPF